MLTKSQIDEFWQNGFIVIKSALGKPELSPLLEDFEQWVEDSRQHSDPFGEMLDGRPRFDVEPDHSGDHPALRRIAAPEEISPAYLKLLQQGKLIETVADILGDGIRFHHAKVNSKLPATATTVKWHQDFTFDPHTNDDCITTMLYLNDVNAESGPPRMVPGSHHGPLYSLRQNGVFTGAVDESVAEYCEQNAVDCCGPAGSLCLMHTRVLHGSAPNHSEHPRTLYIANLTSADAIPLTANAVPSAYSGKIMHGQYNGQIRSIDFQMEMPEVPAGASFFVQQAQQM